jgi:FkbM family methyltransferase
MAEALRANLNRGDTVWDVGANTGLLSMFAAKLVGKRGHVVAFEPSPDVFGVLQQNVNGISSITVSEVGIGSTNGTATFAACGLSPEGAFVRELVERHCGEENVQDIAVQIHSIDHLIEHALYPCPSLIKIDVEGFELEVLKGGKRFLAAERPILIIEIHPYHLSRSGGDDRQLFSLLRELGYDWKVIDRNPNSLYTILAHSGRAREERTPSTTSN